MNAEIEELRKFTKATVSKARVEKLRAALSNATTLFERLEPKPGDEDSAEEFESAQSDLESALGELESACDDLESAEDKDEREEAQDQISNALEEALNYFDEIMPVAVVGDPANAKIIADFKALLASVPASLPKEQVRKHLLDWMQSAPTTEENQKRAIYVLNLQKKNKKPPEVEQSQSPS